MRVNLTRMSIAAAVYLFCFLLQWQAVWSGFTSSSIAAWFTLFLVLGVCGFYATVRSGLSLRFAEPALTMPQMIFATVSISMAYLINPQVRGALLVLVALVLVFGAFTLTPQRCRQLGWIASTVLASVMAFAAWQAPDRFEPQIELVHILFTVIVLPTISILAGQLSKLRIDHQQQRRALRDALQRLELLATHDELTGLPNRRYIHDWMTHELARRSRSGEPMTVAIIDLDNFKRVNDTLGHAVGDQVLRVLTCAALAVLRDGDVLARWGGEEFLLVMPDTSIAAAQVVLDRLRAHIAQEATWVDCPLGRVTFSAGVTLQLQGQSLDVTAHRADGALYEAKRRGRDRVVTAIGAASCPPCSGSAILAPVGSNAVAEDLAQDAGSEH
jgi:diguanylate cyclase (GGDEF)-like protein